MHELPSAIAHLKPHYRSGTSDLATDFFEPCLSHCSRYSRAAAYFTTDALASWVGALPRLLNASSAGIRLLIAPVLSDEDLKALRRAVEGGEAREKLRRKVVDDLLSQLMQSLQPTELSDVRREVFAWMIANERLALRFALPERFESGAIFHEKIGVFEFDGGYSVAFTGSANETQGGHSRNHETLDVFRSWVAGDETRVRTKVQQFEEAWEGRLKGLAISEPSEAFLEQIRTYSPDTPPFSAPKSRPEPENLWRHQDAAIAAFLDKKRGVLEMATGTGKTRTALRIFSTLYELGEIDSLIVATFGTDLLNQWAGELIRWIDEPRISIYRHFDRYHQLGRYVAHPRKSVLVASRQQLASVIKGLPPAAHPRTMIVHDEVHRFGSPQNRAELSGAHRQFRYVLGLSATPERTYDEEGNIFIEEEVGEVIFRFGLSEAIERGILCEFDYHELVFELTDYDRQRLQAVYGLQAARAKEGKPMTKEEVWRRLSDVYKTAENKIPAFSEYLKSNSSALESCIIFVHDTAFGEQLLDLVHGYTSRYSTYYSDDQQDRLEAFAKGELDCLITCHRISEGIDVRGLTTVVLFASDRAKLETIQRMGRCLRTDPLNPEKRALIVDFVRADALDENLDDGEPVSADAERRNWLTQLSRTRRKA